MKKLSEQLNQTQQNPVSDSMVQQWTVDPDRAEQRIDNYLLSRLKGLPKSRLYRLIRRGEIRVNGKRIKPEYRLLGNETIRIPPIRLSGPSRIKVPQDESLSRRILYEDQDLLVIDKPAGIPSHGGTGLRYGVIESLRVTRPEWANLDLVHRLDRNTSGCLILAKTRRALKECHELMRSQRVEKRYYAIVEGHWPAHITVVDEPLIKNQRQSGERMVRVDSEGQRAITHMQIIKDYGWGTLLDVQLVTGRMHQIRVHCAHNGHPVVGDGKYGAEPSEQIPAGCRKRLLLHAYQITLKLSYMKEPITVRSDWTTVLEQL